MALATNRTDDCMLYSYNGRRGLNNTVRNQTLDTIFEKSKFTINDKM